MKTAEVVYQHSIAELVRKILGNEYRPIIVTDLHIHELDLSDPECQTDVEFDLITGTSSKQHIKVADDGMIACIFTGLFDALNDEFKSLDKLSMERFSTHVKKTVRAGGTKGISADERISVEIAIACGSRNLHFEHVSRSLLKSAVVVVINAFEVFINAELAMIKLRRAYDSYIARNRQDLVQDVSNDMAMLVQIMPYDDIMFCSSNRK